MTIKIYSKETIIEEYREAFSSNQEFEKVKWGSKDKMMNRFLWILENIFSDNIKTWLDIGSGTGAFQAIAEETGKKTKAVGIELSKELYEYAKKRKDINLAEFYNKDFLEFENEEKFDLITCIGVLQKTNISIDEFFFKVKNFMKKDSILFIDTKNSEWDMFTKKILSPEESHQWFSKSEIEESANANNLKIHKLTGFIPDDGKEVYYTQSHTIFIILKI